MANPDDVIFWPPLKGFPAAKKWPSGPTLRLVSHTPNTLENSIAYTNAQLEKAMKTEPERYTSDYKKLTRWQRIKRAFGAR